ncbi:HD domain-containing phosphohydrolase [Rhodoferax sp.]|uniref:HD domain-containing phosphohydrolase n=1 Tax=Rhodoferax sp. TaxID=50421 RepID=UPI0026173252|nr:HD domain-containing phosphohydrolase [Rhodoferax sp.]MDD2923861.1 response regulator [Rhodoferax sp.]
MDDEPSILSALRRLFRAKGFQVKVAEGGQAGLEMLENEPVDLVISDMRMPEMDGVTFLEQVRQRWPDTMRLLLTGYADITSIMGAINRGEIYRYIAKPWDDNDIILIVRGALQHHALELEQKRLQALVQQQNEELKTLNTSLEIKVEERTAELKRANTALHGANERLKNNFITSIKVFTSLIELRNSHIAGHSRRVADLARRLAIQLELDNKQVQEIFVAGLLHEVGKVGFDDEMLETPIVMLNTRQLVEFRKHPARAAQLLLPLGELKGSVEIIGAQLERFDGAGYPNQLSGTNIPIGARILSVACDYDSLQIGVLAQRKLDVVQAQNAVVQGSGRRFDPDVVEALVVLHGVQSREQLKKNQPQERTMSLYDLEPGMVLSRDLVTPSGLLMLTAGHVLDDLVIRKILEFQRSSDLKLTADVWQDPKV